MVGQRMFRDLTMMHLLELLGLTTVAERDRALDRVREIHTRKVVELMREIDVLTDGLKARKARLTEGNCSGRRSSAKALRGVRV